MSNPTSKPTISQSESAKIKATLAKLGLNVQLSASTAPVSKPLSVYVGKVYDYDKRALVKDYQRFECSIDGIKSAIICLRALNPKSVLYFSIAYNPYDFDGNAISTQADDFALLSSLTSGFVPREGVSKLPFKGINSKDGAMDGNFNFELDESFTSDDAKALA